MQSHALQEQMFEHQLGEQLRQLDERKTRDQNQEFQEALKALLEQYGFSAADAAHILFPQGLETSTGPSRPLMVFRNPYTREEVRTRSFNHARLNDWRRRHGRLTVQLWQVR